MIYPWQAAQWAQVQNQLQQQRVPHATLLLGAQGLGKHAFAVEMAQTLLCEQQSTSPCRTCHACHLFEAQTHPDFFEVALSEKSKVIKVDQIRALIQKTAASPHQGIQQVVIIQPAESLHAAAANALLKTLEEPTGHVVYLLVAHQLGALPATIVSRCLKLHFSVQDPAAAKTWLEKELSSTAQTDALLQLAGGAPLAALALAEADHLAVYGRLVEGLMDVIERRRSVVAVSAALTQAPLPTLYQVFMHLVMSLLKARAGCEELRLVQGVSSDAVRYLAERLSAKQLKLLASHVMQVFRFLREASNVNCHLLLESVLTQMETA